MNALAYVTAVTVLTVVSVIIAFPLQAVYGSGSFAKEIEPSDWYETRLPFVLSFNTTTINNESAAIRFTLYENGTGQVVPNVSYLLSITEVESNETLLTDAFYTSDGRVFLNVIHDGEFEGIRIEGTREQFLNAQVANNASEPVVIRGSELSLDRMYNIEIAILGAYNIRSLAPPDQVPVVDLVWNPQDGDAATEVMVVPEFGSILPILFASTVGIVIAASRSNSRRIFRDSP